jgi:hypothetical protein
VIALLAAVDLVDNKMREIAQRTKSTIAERVAVMAALNIAHEHLAGGSPKTQKELWLKQLILPTQSVESMTWEHGLMPCLRPSRTGLVVDLLTPAPPAERPLRCLLRPYIP